MSTLISILVDRWSYTNILRAKFCATSIVRVIRDVFETNIMASDDDSEIGDDILDDLLANTDDVQQSTPKKKLEELSFNFIDSQCNTPEIGKIEDNKTSVVHEHDVDSSDDEDKKNFEEQKYSEYGRDLKNLLKHKNDSSRSEAPKFNGKTENPLTSLSKSLGAVSKPESPKSIVNTNKTVEKTIVPSKDVYSDPIFGIRIVKPLISSAELTNRMKGRKAVTVSKIKYHLTSESLNDDWVIAGILINRSATKTSQKGSQYCIWKLSDLGEQMNTVSIFVFSGAYKLFWKTATGTVIGILNPNVMESKDSIDLATLSVDNAQKVMILGNSRDMGKCKSVKKSGEPCANIVNLSQCEYCIYHVKQEYKKASRRPDLQSNANGFASSMGQKKKTPLTSMYSQNLNNQKFTPILAVRNAKQYEKDSTRLALLRGATSMPNAPVKEESGEKKTKAYAVDMTPSQMKKDLNRLNKLRGWNPQPVSVNSASAQNLVPDQKKTLTLQNLSPSSSSPVPRLGMGARGGKIDFSEPITKKHIDKARSNALRWIKDNGALKQSNPNKICESRDKKLNAGTKRQREIVEEETANEKIAKKALIDDKFKKMMEAKSAHTDLVEMSEEAEKDAYFDKLEAKERMEEKMLTTYKVECKAVKCLVCKYTAYSSSDFCKEQRHPLRVIDAIKSFFKCKDCGNRTTSLDRIPSESCKKCQGSHWIRAPMMAERKTDIPSAALSIRGGEEKFIGSISQDANINLLVPDSGTADS